MRAGVDGWDCELALASLGDNEPNRRRTIVLRESKYMPHTGQSLFCAVNERKRVLKSSVCIHVFCSFGKIVLSVRL